jgi:hypothetical protein
VGSKNGNDDSLISVGDRVTLLEGRIRAQCTSGNCAANLNNTMATVTVLAPTNPTKPQVVLNIAKSSAPCDDLTIDATGSTGYSGRDWDAVIWNVIAGSNDSSPDRLISFLNGSDVFSVIKVPQSLLNITTFEISLTLRNFLKAQSSATTEFTISDDRNAPTVSIPGAGGS